MSVKKCTKKILHKFQFSIQANSQHNRLLDYGVRGRDLLFFTARESSDLYSVRDDARCLPLLNRHYVLKCNHLLFKELGKQALSELSIDVRQGGGGRDCESACLSFSRPEVGVEADMLCCDEERSLEHHACQLRAALCPQRASETCCAHN